MDHSLLANIWALLIGLILVLYVVTDGFDLGVGMLSLFAYREEHRSLMMSSIGAVWDANETWLVIAGGALFGAFPLVYSVVLNALYIPISMMLMGLVFRAVSFEFRGHSQNKRTWGVLFGVGSLAAVLGHGLTLGGLLSEIKVDANGFAGGAWDWLNPLSGLVAVAVVFGYAMIGASYLVAKTRGEMRRYIYRLLMGSSILMFASVVVITLSMPFLYDLVSRRWFKDPARFYLYALVVGAAFSYVMLMLSLRYRRYTFLPFLCSLGVFVVAFVGLVVAIYPYLIPTSVTIEQGAAANSTLLFMLVGIGPLIPAMLLYNFYLYRTFRGQLQAGSETHEERAYGA